MAGGSITNVWLADAGRKPLFVPAGIAVPHKAMDLARHPALLLVGTIASLVTTDYRHDALGVGVSIIDVSGF